MLSSMSRAIGLWPSSAVSPVERTSRRAVVGALSCIETIPPLSNAAWRRPAAAGAALVLALNSKARKSRLPSDIHRSGTARASSTQISGNDQTLLQSFIDSINTRYEQVHLKFEEQFWGTKMALQSGRFSVEQLTETKGALEAFLADPKLLQETRDWLQSGEGTEDQKKTLRMFERTFSCYIMESDDAKKLREEGTKIEGVLESKRNQMKLGADLPGEGFVELSSVGLRSRMRVDDDEAVRKACFEGLQSVGPFVCQNGFVELIKKRNQMAKSLGYEDFYDYKVTQAEGFNKAKLFEILDTLEIGTRDQLERAKSTLVKEKGESALLPWNTGYMLAGDVTKKLDPYFPFEKAVDAWARSYAAMGIQYKDATMTLDLLDRKGKYSNGFCHWPQPPWVRSDGSWQPSAANFTSLADPRQVGSGYTALTTLMHEAGHAAHMANVVQPSPLFAQERAPMSVAYAENQSMFLDSLCKDSAWRGRYAHDRNGRAIPWELIHEDLCSRHPYEVFTLRRMISVPYFEKALYELPESEVTAERIAELAAEVEERIGGGPSPLPLTTVPHILSDEASCYYHGYVLAEMAVHQTRAHFLDKYGKIVDNPEVGPTLADAYWKPGNSAVFLDLVASLTGKPLSGDDWVHELQRPLEEVLKAEEEDYKAAVAEGPAFVEGDEVDLGMRVRIVDGDKVLADSAEDGSFSVAASRFEQHVQTLVAS